MAGDPDRITEETNAEELITRFPRTARVYRQPLAEFLGEIRSILKQG